MFPTVNLHTSDGHFVTKVRSLPYKFWPQALQWGARTFIRRDALRDPRHETETPPDYYEISVMAIPPQEMFDLIGKK